MTLDHQPRLPMNSLPSRLLTGMYATENYLKETDLPFELLELLRSKVAIDIGCAFCTDMHWKLARQVGVGEQKLYALRNFEEFDVFSEPERAVLRWCARLFEGGPKASFDRDFKALSGHFSAEQCAQITLAIAQATAWAQLSRGFGLIAGTFEVPKHGHA